MSVAIGFTPLSLRDVHEVAGGGGVVVAEQAWDKVRKSRRLVEELARGKEPVYGVTTGFGALAEVRIDNEQLLQLQRNLVLSHAAGVGKPLGREETRAMMLLRAHTLALGYSGVRPDVVELLVGMLNRKVHPVIPEKGSVGASGDLAPLAHLALAMIGEGLVELDNQRIPARDAMTQASLRPLELQAKEGLALINGTQAMAALGSLCLVEAERLCCLADIAGAMTLEALVGLPEAFDERIHRARPHQGQLVSAENVRRIVAGSRLVGSHASAKLQDPYSIRCLPQVHGATRDAVRYTLNVLTTEINSATDNPLVFADDQLILSGGNFHGQPLALAFDFVCMGIAELANIAERRIEQLVNPSLSGLPAFLIQDSGIHCGYMIAQVTAASLVNENKVLANPACTDSIPGSASREDHVSMGMTSARKLREVVSNTRAVLAVEILCATQALDFRGPEQAGVGTRAVHTAVREAVAHLDVDRLMARDLEGVIALERRGVLVGAVEAAIGALA